MPYVEYATIGFQPRRSVLLCESRVDLVLGRGQPEFERLGVAFDICVKDFREDILTHFPEERFNLERRVHFTELFDNSSSLIFSEKASNAVRDAASCGDEGVFGFVIA